MESLWCGGMQGTHRFNEREEVVEGFFFFFNEGCGGLWGCRAALDILSGY